MEAIPVPPEFFTEFENVLPGNSTPGTADSMPDVEVSEMLQKSLDWLFNTVNEIAGDVHKKLAIDKKEIPKISQLTSIVIQKHVSADILKNSPEIMLGTIVIGIATEKTITYNRLLKAGEIHKKEESKPAENE